jgi:hypothetical protein
MDFKLPVFISAVVILYLWLIRPWQLRWGASDDEIARSMAGDEVVKAPTFYATRAVTIRARPEHIFPWIVQMGVTRAGWYSIDLLDNLGKPSAEVLHPELQHPHPGDLIPMSPDGKQGLYIKDFVPGQWMLWGDHDRDMTWVWGLYPIDEKQTRVVTRVRLKYRWLSPSIVFALLIEFTDIIMMRKCMLGIQRRAERLAQESLIVSEAQF